jgi:iron complex transport system substrate-binding protein
VFSLDQCADQYVLALAPRDRIVGLSPRVADQDSYLRALSVGLPRRRASAEAVLAAGPDVVVRYWGGDERLARVLTRRKVAVVKIDEAADFDQVRVNIRRVAAALDAQDKGEALIAHLNDQLRQAHGAWGGRQGLYLTSGGFTAGPGTLIDAVLRAAGFSNAATAPGYEPVSLERLALDPPQALVLGFFDGYGLAQQQWGPGRHPLIRRLAVTRAVASLPASLLGCPAWFAGDAVQALGQASVRRRGAS